MRSFFRKSVLGVLGLVLLAAVGCRSINAKMNTDGSWEASYYSYGLFTTLGALQVSVGTNGVASLALNDLTSDVSTNHITIVDSSGKVIADIAGQVIPLVTVK